MVNDMNLKTSEERVELLKRGFTGTEIENKYIELNDLKIVNITQSKK